MGPALITTAMMSMRFIKDCLQVALGDTMEHSIKVKMHDAIQQAGMVQDTLFQTREELVRLRIENTQLRQELQAQTKFK